MLNLAKTTTISDFFMDLNEKDSETISGGYEGVMIITNATKYNVDLRIDDMSFTHRPGETWTYTVHGGGTMSFDTDVRAGYQQSKTYNLADGGVYEFRDNRDTPCNPYDIELHSV